MWKRCVMLPQDVKAKLFYGNILLGMVLLFPVMLQAYPDAVIHNVSLEEVPKKILAHPKERFLYILSETGFTLSIVDALTFDEIKVLTLENRARDFTFSSSQDKIYLLRSNSESIGILSLGESLSSPVEDTEIILPEGDHHFDFLRSSIEGSDERAILVDQAARKLFFLDVDDETYLDLSGDDFVELDFEPRSVDVTERDRAVILGEAGEIEVFLLSSGTRASPTTELDSKTDTENFTLTRSGTIGSLDYLAFTNDGSPGEVFLASILTGSDEFSFIDFDPDLDALDPLLLGEGLRDVFFGEVPRPDNSSEDTSTYLFASNALDRTLSVVDLSDLDPSEKLEPLSTIEDIEAIPEGGILLTSADDGYLYLLDPSNHRIRVLSDHPKLALFSLPEGPQGEDFIEIQIKSSEAGTVRVLKVEAGENERINENGGEVLGRHDLLAGEKTSVGIDLTGFEEGENVVAFFLEKGGRLGRVGFRVERDVPPPKPQGFKLAFGKEKVFVDWDPVDVEDLSHYLIYFGEGSPEGGSNDLISPQRVGKSQSALVLEPLLNDVEISIRLRAVDQNGNFSPFTKTLSEIPEETIGLLSQVNEKGGCASTSSPWEFFLILLLFLPWAFGFSGFVKKHFPIFLLTLLASTLAQAESDQNLDLNAWNSNASFEVGFFLPSNDLVESFFGKAGNESFSLRYGVEWTRLETSLAFGFSRESASLIGASSGRKSGERMRLFLVPIEASTQYNLRIWPKQLFLPFIRLGYSLLYFDLEEPILSESGWKSGLQGSFGFRWMLGRFTSGEDTLDLLGLKDFYLEFLASYRWQISKGIDFSGWIFHPALGVSF